MAKDKKIKISFLIANYNSTDLLIKCVESILNKCNFDNKEIIIIDDCSNDIEKNKLHEFMLNPSKDIPEKYWENIRFKCLKENKGIGNAMNQGVGLARSDIIIRLDSDIEVVTDNFDDKLIRFLKQDKSLGLVTCRTGTIGQSLQRIKIPDYFIENNKEEEYMDSLDMPNLTYCTEPSEVLSGFCFAFRKSDLIKHNIKFNTEMKMYGEDGIFHFDILKAGLKAAIANKLYMYHKHHGTTGKIDSNVLNEERNKALKIWLEYLKNNK